MKTGSLHILCSSPFQTSIRCHRFPWCCSICKISSSHFQCPLDPNSRGLASRFFFQKRVVSPLELVPYGSPGECFSTLWSRYFFPHEIITASKHRIPSPGDPLFFFLRKRCESTSLVSSSVKTFFFHRALPHAWKNRQGIRIWRLAKPIADTDTVRFPSSYSTFSKDRQHSSARNCPRKDGRAPQGAIPGAREGVKDPTAVSRQGLAIASRTGNHRQEPPTKIGILFQKRNSTLLKWYPAL